MRKVKVAAVQMSMSSSREENISKAEKLVREAAASVEYCCSSIFIFG